MGLNARQLREIIVRPALEDIGKWSQAAENLVMGTAAQESHLEYVHQLGGGPALGLFQVEPATYYDYWIGYLADTRLRATILDACDFDVLCTPASGPEPENCIYNLRFAAMMCRVHYLRIREALPHADDLHGLATYWKKYYNTVHGRGTVDEFIENYQRVAVNPI